MFQSLVLQLYGSRHDTTCALYHQAKKSLTNIFIVFFYQTGYLWRQSVEELDIPGPE